MLLSYLTKENLRLPVRHICLLLYLSKKVKDSSHFLISLLSLFDLPKSLLNEIYSQLFLKVFPKAAVFRHKALV